MATRGKTSSASADGDFDDFNKGDGNSGSAKRPRKNAQNSQSTNGRKNAAAPQNAKAHKDASVAQNANINGKEQKIVRVPQSGQGQQKDASAAQNAKEQKSSRVSQNAKARNAKPAKKRRKTKRKKIVLGQMQTALVALAVVAACFIILIFNANGVKNQSGETAQIAERAGEAQMSVEQENALAARPQTQTENAEQRNAANASENVALQSNENAERRNVANASENVALQSNETAANANVNASESVAPQSNENAVAVRTQTQENAQRNTSNAMRGTERNARSANVATAFQSNENAQVAMNVRPPTIVTPTTPDVPAQPKTDLPEIPEAKNGAKLVFVFDDAGQNMSQLEKFVTLPFPVTVAVLPKLTHSKDAAARVRLSGNEVMLHQPMQALDLNVNPGPGAVLPEMQSSEIAALVKENIAEIGPVAGVNNHEGSLIAEDEIKIGAVMRAASESGAFFLDSRTTSQSRVRQASMELDIPYYERNVFLDNSKERGEIIKEIMRGVEIANEKGAAIMIGHVWSADVLPGILIEMYPALRNKGYTFTTVSESGAAIAP